MSHGHRWSDILDYPIALVLFFDLCIEKARVNDRADLVTDVAIGFHAESKERIRYVRTLKKASGRR